MLMVLVQKNGQLRAEIVRDQLVITAYLRKKEQMKQNMLTEGLVPTGDAKLDAKAAKEYVLSPRIIWPPCSPRLPVSRVRSPSSSETRNVASIERIRRSPKRVASHYLLRLWSNLRRVESAETVARWDT